MDMALHLLFTKATKGRESGGKGNLVNQNTQELDLKSVATDLMA